MVVMSFTSSRLEREMAASSAYNSPSRSPGPGSMRLQLGAISRLRSSSMKKPPEPLRRSVADCLSSSSSAAYSSISALSSSSHHHGSPSVLASEASRTLRDYLAASSTTDLAYCVILEHTLAERERSPAVVGRCVALLKRYLLRYKPSEETLVQIDRFCLHIIAECDAGLSRRLLPWSHSLNQQYGAGKASANSSTPLPVSTFASEALVKSLHYVRSLVAQHIPKRSFQPAAFAGAPTLSRQSLPSLSSMLSRSFNSQLSPANAGDSADGKEAALSIQNLSNTDRPDGTEGVGYITSDVLKWRWAGDMQSTISSTDGDHNLNSSDFSTHNLLELGAATLIVTDVEGIINGQAWRQFGTADMPYLDQLLQPSSISSGTSSSSAHYHLRIITASKRAKSGSQQIWEDTLVSTFHPRARPLFQYRHYRGQQPLRLNPIEVGEVIAAVCSETFVPNANLMTISTPNNNRQKPSIDMAVSVLVKLLIDMYISDSVSAAPLTLSLLEDMVSCPRLSSRTRAFDLVLNLAVHAHLLEPVPADDVSTIEEDYSQESFYDSEAQLGTQRKNTVSCTDMSNSCAIDKFEFWILNILYKILVLLVQIEEKEESVWASAMSCLLYFVCDGGKIRRNRLKGLDIRVMKALIEVSRLSSWAEIVHSKLISMLTSMFYELPDGGRDVAIGSPLFIADQVDLIGGIDFLFMEYSLARTREERRNLYLLLFDYVLHQINVSNICAGVPEYGTDEIQPIASLLSLANAPEAFHISVKLGVRGIGGILRGSVSTALSRYEDSKQLNILLEKIMVAFDSIISSFTHLEKEFSQLRQVTKSYKLLESIDDVDLGRNIGGNVKLSWATLHSLLHSERMPCRRNGYIWMSELLLSEISEGGRTGVQSSIKILQRQIYFVGLKDPSTLKDIPLSIWLMCGLLKSKNSIIRGGFLFILEKLLMRCKFLLDENEQRQTTGITGDTHADSRLGNANLLIDIMSSSLSLVAQRNETDHLNILKMCDILFSQLCLKVPPGITTTPGDMRQLGGDSGGTGDRNEHLPRQEPLCQRSVEDVDNFYSSLVCETSSLAALLLQGQAVVPMQLVARVPTVLFYWPLIQLAGAATDNIALGVSVGSKGRGNLPGATSDIRAALLLLLIAKCTADPAAFQDLEGEAFFRHLLDDTDSRVAYYSSAFLLKRMMTDNFERYQQLLQNLVFKAQQSNNEKLLENPYLQMRGILHLSNDLGTGL